VGRVAPGARVIVGVVVVVVGVVTSTAYFVGVGVVPVLLVPAVSVVVDGTVVDVVVLTSKPFLMVILLTANPVVGKSVLVPSMRNY